jgi:hypothetical protein
VKPEYDQHESEYVHYHNTISDRQFTGDIKPQLTMTPKLEEQSTCGSDTGINMCSVHGNSCSDGRRTTAIKPHLPNAPACQSETTYDHYLECDIKSQMPMKLECDQKSCWSDPDMKSCGVFGYSVTTEDRTQSNYYSDLYSHAALWSIPTDRTEDECKYVSSAVDNVQLDQGIQSPCTGTSDCEANLQVSRDSSTVEDQNLVSHTSTNVNNVILRVVR